MRSTLRTLVSTATLALLVLLHGRGAAAQSVGQAVKPADLIGNWAREGSKAPYLTFSDTTLAVGKALNRWHLTGDTVVVDAALRDGQSLVGMRRLVKLDGQRLTLTEPDGEKLAQSYVRTKSRAEWAADQRIAGGGGEVKCVNGKARGFDCRNVDLVAFLPAEAIEAEVGMVTPFGEDYTGGPVKINTVWGWVDSATGREFALVGLTAAIAFVEITDPATPRYLGQLPSHGENLTLGRDVKVYKNHAFIVSDAGSTHGMQVFDLTQLRDVQNPPVFFQETAHYDKLGTAHTLAINERTGYAYAVMVSGQGETCGGQLHMIDIRHPTTPTFAGCYASDANSTHETVCVVYHGPDKAHRGREICADANGKAVEFVDVTDKQHPKTVSTATYPSVGYAHQGWFSEDQRYFFLDDEHDNGANGIAKTRTIVFDLVDLGDPVVLTEFYGTTKATDHNLYIRGRYMYQANYKAGLRVIDIADPKNPKEVGYFDTYPTDDGPGFGGAWSNFPYFKKDGLVAVSSMAQGLFLLRFRPTK